MYITVTIDNPAQDVNTTFFVIYEYQGSEAGTSLMAASPTPSSCGPGVTGEPGGPYTWT